MDIAAEVEITTTSENLRGSAKKRARRSRDDPPSVGGLRVTKKRKMRVKLGDLSAKT